MAVYFSFHYARDAWRVQQIANMGAVEGQSILNSQGWESVKAGGNAAIERWIEEQMSYKTAVVVLVGRETASREWVHYEMIKAWKDKRRLVGVRIHGLSDNLGSTDSAGENPFSKVTMSGGGTMADYVPLYAPTGSTSQAVYTNIKANLSTWVAAGYKPS